LETYQKNHMFSLGGGTMNLNLILDASFLEAVLAMIGNATATTGTFMQRYALVAEIVVTSCAALLLATVALAIAIALCVNLVGAANAIVALVSCGIGYGLYAFCRGAWTGLSNAARGIWRGLGNLFRGIRKTGKRFNEDFDGWVDAHYWKVLAVFALVVATLIWSMRGIDLATLENGVAHATYVAPLNLVTDQDVFPATNWAVVHELAWPETVRADNISRASRDLFEPEAFRADNLPARVRVLSSEAPKPLVIESGDPRIEVQIRDAELLRELSGEKNWKVGEVVPHQYETPKVVREAYAGRELTFCVELECDWYLRFVKYEKRIVPGTWPKWEDNVVVEHEFHARTSHPSIIPQGNFPDPICEIKPGGWCLWTIKTTFPRIDGELHWAGPEGTFNPIPGTKEHFGISNPDEIRAAAARRAVDPNVPKPSD
jgi:hypothetical protein